MSTQQKVFEVRNPGPVREFTLRADKGPGVYVLAGPNGAGKSSILRAIAKALGYSVPVNLRHGAKTLSVEMDGENLYETSKVKPTGDIENALMKASPLARFILPGLADDDRNEAARNEAFFELVDIPVTVEAIRVLVQDNDDAFSYVVEKEGDELLEEKIVDAADKVRRRVHELKRQYESTAEKSQGEIDAHTVEKPAVLSKISSRDARTQYETAVRAQERLRGQVEQRETQERRFEEIRQTQGERPDVLGMEAGHETARENLRTITATVVQLEQQLAVAKSQQDTYSKAAAQAAQAVDRVRGEAALWDRNKELLGAPITGATRDQLEEAIQAALVSEQDLERARVTEAYQESCRLRTEAQQTREASLAKATAIEKIATAVTSQLSLLFAESGIKNLTIDEGRLCTVNADGSTGEPLYELSAGERTAIGCGLLSRNKFPHEVVILPGQFWGNLDENSKTQVSASIGDAELYAFTEEPTIGDGEIRVFQQPKTNGHAAADAKAKTRKGSKATAK